MAEENAKRLNNNEDPLDINELASLNEEVSVDVIEQLEGKLSADSQEFQNSGDDSELFEEVDSTNKPKKAVEKAIYNENLDDNFIKKYKARLNKQNFDALAKKDSSEPDDTQDSPSVINAKEKLKERAKDEERLDASLQQSGFDNNASIQEEPENTNVDSSNIEVLSKGKIKEIPATPEQIEYNDSLDLLDDNVKYTKYVIYVNPENTDFMNSLTIKERKNLINRILREQDDIAITKRRFSMIQSVIKHVIIMIITITLTIPVVYFSVNMSLEASINNYRKSQTLFKNLYREKGKIQKISNIR